MKGGIQGLKISQVSLILIGLVCTTVLVLAWTKTSFLTDFIQSPSRVLQLDLAEVGQGEIFKVYNFSSPIRTELVEQSASSSEIELADGREDVDNRKNTDKEESPSSVMKRWESDELSDGKNKSSLAENFPKNSSDSELSVEREENGNLSDSELSAKSEENGNLSDSELSIKGEENGNLSAVDNKKESRPSVPEGTGSEELSGVKNKSKESENVLESSLSVGSSVKKEQIVNLSATIGKDGKIIENISPQACIFCIS